MDSEINFLEKIFFNFVKRANFSLSFLHIIDSFSNVLLEKVLFHELAHIIQADKNSITYHATLLLCLPETLSQNLCLITIIGIALFVGIFATDSLTWV